MLYESGIIIRSYTKISAARGETGTEWTTFCWDVIARVVWIHDNDFRFVCIKLQEIILQPDLDLI